MSISNLQRNSSESLQYLLFDEVASSNRQNPKGETEHCVSIRFPQGSYLGEVKDHKPHGEGRFLYFDLREYRGQWSNGEKTHGTLFFPDGSEYTGEFEKDMLSGFGIYKTQGSVYSGYFKDGKKHGRGNLVFSSGEQISGEWINDQLQQNWTCSSANLSQKKESQCLIA